MKERWKYHEKTFFNGQGLLKKGSSAFSQRKNQ